MKTYSSDRIKNIGFIAGGGEGKTTLCEAVLFNAKAANRFGKVEEGNTVMDYDPEEVSRGNSINVSIAWCEWNDKKFNLIDTPGYANFIADTKGCMRVVDGAVVVISADEGIKPQTEKVWKWADESNIPRVVFINKMDNERGDIISVFDDIRKKFSQNPVKVHIPVGKGDSFYGVIDLIRMKSLVFNNNNNGDYREEDIPDDLKSKADQHRQDLLDAAAESDDKLLEKYLDKGELSDEELLEGLRSGVWSGKIVPVLCGSAVRNTGVVPLMDFIAEYLPSPVDRGGLEGDDPATHDRVERSCSEKSPLSAFIFKTKADQYGRLSLLKVMSGTLNVDSTVYNSTKEKEERIGHIYLLQGKKQTAISSASAGDLAAVHKLKHTSTGDTLCDKMKAVRFDPIKFPDSVYSLAIEPKTKEDEEKVSVSLSKLIEEDPALHMDRDNQTRELIISGMGQLHLEVVIGKLKRKFDVDVDAKTPKVPYKESIKKTTKVQGKYKKQSGGRGQYGDTWIEIEPLPRGSGFEFVNKIAGGAIPKQYIPAVEKGVVEALGNGVISGYPMVDVKVTLYDGSFHEVDSSEMAFKIAGSMALKKGAVMCGPYLLEPIKNMDVSIPSEYVGDVIGDLNSRRGKVVGIEPMGEYQVVKCQVPLAEILKYAPDLRSITGGRGSFTAEFSHYDEVPGHMAEKIIDKANKKGD